jgi:hypothetical protein
VSYLKFKGKDLWHDPEEILCWKIQRKRKKLARNKKEKSVGGKKIQEPFHPLIYVTKIILEEILLQ